MRLALFFVAVSACASAEEFPVIPYTDPAQLDCPWPLVSILLFHFPIKSDRLLEFLAYTRYLAGCCHRAAGIHVAQPRG